MPRLMTLSALIALPFASILAQDKPAANRICLVPPSTEVAAGSAETASTAVQAAFTSFLAGPTLGVTPLKARLASQARQEAAQESCRFVLFTTIKHQHKTSNSFLRRAAGNAVESGASQMMGSARGVGARAAARAAASAAGAVRDLSYAVKTRDEMMLTFRLESGDGVILLTKSEARTAKSDGEDLLTPLVEQAAEAIAAAVDRR